MINNLPQHIVRCFLAMSLLVLFFEFSSVDMWVQQLFYDNALSVWLIDHDAQPWRTLLYTGIKKVFIFAALGLFLCVTLLHRRFAWLAANRKELTVVLLTMVCVPVVVNILKWATDVPCPRDILPFGGTAPYISLLEHYPAWFLHDTSLRCYPAGHASGGFALMSLFFLFKTKTQRLQGLAIGLSIGWVTGLYKMAIGDHFLSHTIVSMLLAWIIACLIAYFVLRDKMPQTEERAEILAIED